MMKKNRSLHLNEYHKCWERFTFYVHNELADSKTRFKNTYTVYSTIVNEIMTK